MARKIPLLLISWRATAGRIWRAKSARRPLSAKSRAASIAIGHPFGATGARVTTQLLYELRRRDLNLGLVTICAAGGVGFSMVVERL